MKLRSAWKILPILSAIALTACFVAYRSEQAKPSSEPNSSPAGDKTVMPGSKNPNRPVVFPSSKGLTSGDPAINRNNIDTILKNREEQAAKQGQKTVLPSSKIGAILKKEDVPKGNKTVFPSSKNIDAVLPPGSIFPRNAGTGVDGIPKDPDHFESHSDSEKAEGATPKP